MNAQPETNLRRTPLYHCHEELGGKFVPFAGWEMPVLYRGVIEEHRACRTAAGLFDVSHMGELRVRGPEALRLIQYVSCNDASKLVPGKAQYSALLNERGGVVDDIIVYKFADDDFFICVNASNADKDFAWIKKHNAFDASVENHSDDYAQVALQGPRAREIAAKTLRVPLEKLSGEAFPPFTFQERNISLPGVGATGVIMAATGYTGEDGFEIFCPAQAGAALWKEILSLGADAGICPVGLGARDTLRLEVCYPLHGHELRDDLSALVSGLGWIVKLNKGCDFVGREALARETDAGLKQKLCAFAVRDRGIVRENAKIFNVAGEEVGWTTSGTMTPTLNMSVGMCIVSTGDSGVGTKLFADVRGKKLAIEIVKSPLYRKK